MVFQMLVKFDNVVEHQGMDLARAIHHTHECLGSHSKEHYLAQECFGAPALSTSASLFSSFTFLSSCGRRAARRHASAFATLAKLTCVCPALSTGAFSGSWSVFERLQLGVLARGLAGSWSGSRGRRRRRSGSRWSGSGGSWSIPTARRTAFDCLCARLLDAVINQKLGVVATVQLLLPGPNCTKQSQSELDMGEC